MTLGQHLVELRKRLVRAAAGLVVGGVVGWFLSDLVMAAMRAPVEAIVSSQHRTAALNFSTITGSFDLKLEIALTVGAIVSSPVWLYQIFAFLVPGLTGKEKRYIFGFFFSAVPLFFAGCAAGWFVLPHIVGLLTGFAGRQDSSYIDAPTYYDFVLKLVMVIGVAFVLPVFLVLLNFIGVISAKAIRKSWRVALLVIVLFTAVATPSADVVSMLLLAVPMIALYFLAAGVAWLHDRRAEKAAIRLDAEFEV